MADRVLPLFADEDSKAIIKNLCARHGLSMDLFIQMLNIQKEYLGQGRQIGISQDFSAAIADFLDQEDSQKAN